MGMQLSQEEIDRLFREHGPGQAAPGAPSKQAAPYDFRRPDRIPKEQLRSIHLMHDFLARNLASSLGAYLRAYITASLVSVEQLSFGEFLQYLPTPTCIASVGMHPLDGNSVLEINPSLILPMLDILLGGNGQVRINENHELTEIEQSIAEGILRIVLHDLREAWAPVATIDFGVENIETQPQLMQILSANEAIVAIGFEVMIGESRGMMNFGVPSIMVKMMGQRFEQQWSLRRRSASEADRRRMRTLAKRAPMRLDARVEGAKIALRNLLELDDGDVLSLDLPIERELRLRVNGAPKFQARVAADGGRRVARVTAATRAPAVVAAAAEEAGPSDA